MIVRLIKKKKIYNFTLPIKISGNYWITDNDYLGNVRNLINVEESNGKWKIKSDFETKIMDGTREIESAFLSDHSIYFLKINTDNEYVILYCSPSIDNSVHRLKLRGTKEIVIGNSNDLPIQYNFPLVSKQHAKLIFENGKWMVTDLNSKYGTYVNNNAITSCNLNYGDIIFIMGLEIIVLSETIIISENDRLILNDNYFTRITPPIQKQVEFDNPDEENIEFYKEDDYFYRAPRFKSGIEEAIITVEPPPGKEEEDKTPLFYTIGPMITMGMMSMTMGVSSIQGLIEGTTDFKTASPTLMMTGAMLSTMFLWPTLQKRYQNNTAKKKKFMGKRNKSK